MRTMLDYGIADGVMKRKETLVTNSFWKKHVRLDPYDQITIDEEEEDERYGLYTWKVTVPLILTFRGARSPRITASRRMCGWCSSRQRTGRSRSTRGMSVPSPAG